MRIWSLHPRYLDAKGLVALWREALLARKQEVLALGFDETFLRRWTYYFSYCEAGFRTRLVRNYHLVLARMGEPVEAS